MRCRKGLRARFTIQSTPPPPPPPFVIECSHLHVPNPGESCTHTLTHMHTSYSLHNLLHVDERGADRGPFSAFPRDVCAVLPNVEEFPHSRAHAVTSRSRVFGGSNPSTLVILGEIPRTHNSEVMSSESGGWGGDYWSALSLPKTMCSVYFSFTSSAPALSRLPLRGRRFAFPVRSSGVFIFSA